MALAVATLVMVLIFYTPEVAGGAMLGSLISLGIASACFYAALRIGPTGSAK
jgi:hypothetical protein